MRIEQIKQFIEVAASESINVTAQQRYISQQGLSDSLKRMEQELGIALLKKDKTGAFLTQAGSDLLEYFQDIVASFQKIEDYVLAQRLSQLEKKEHIMRILANPMAMSVLVPDLLDIIEAHYGFLTVHCTDVAPLDEMAQAITHNTTDYCIFMLMQFDVDTMLHTLPDDVRVYPLFEDELVACVSRDTELASREYFSAQEFDAMEKVLFNGAYTSPQEHTAEYVSNNTDFQLKTILRHKAIGVSIHSFVKKAFPENLIAAIPIQPPQKIRYYLMFANNRTLSDADFIFLNVLSELLQSATGQKPGYNLHKLFPPKKS